MDAAGLLLGYAPTMVFDAELDAESASKNYFNPCPIHLNKKERSDVSLPDADSVSDSRAVDNPHWNGANPRLEMPKIHRYIYKNLRLKSA